MWPSRRIMRSSVEGHTNIPGTLYHRRYTVRQIVTNFNLGSRGDNQIIFSFNLLHIV
jgi:hypothetical protein